MSRQAEHKIASQMRCELVSTACPHSFYGCAARGQREQQSKEHGHVPHRRKQADPLVIKDLRPTNNAPTLDKLRDQAQYPFSMLDEQLIAPCMTLNLPGQAVGLVAETGPVLAVQANFILGGLILTVVAQHNVMDMVGLATVMNWLQKRVQARSSRKKSLQSARSRRAAS